MEDPYAVGRRGFLKTAAVAAAGTAVACGGPDSRWRVLTETEATTLAAACDQIIPPDHDPGASQAGVVSFIDRQLATRQRKDLPSWRAGIAALDATARRRYRLPFSELPDDAQVAILEAMQAGTLDAADWGEVEPAEFFGRLRQYSMMGFYGDPRHGGNRDRAAWQMIGMPDPPIRGRLHETPPPPALAPRPPRPALIPTASLRSPRKG
jgi:gluconate 2-dehydrogenase gamma chain